MPPRIGNTKAMYYKRALDIIKLRNEKKLTFGQIEQKHKLCRGQAATIYHYFKNKKCEILLWLIESNNNASPTKKAIN